MQTFLWENAYLTTQSTYFCDIYRCVFLKKIRKNLYKIHIYHVENNGCKDVRFTSLVHMLVLIYITTECIFYGIPQIYI